MADREKKDAFLPIAALGTGLGLLGGGALNWLRQRRHHAEVKKQRALHTQPHTQLPGRRLPGELYVAEPNDPGDSPN